MKNKILITCPPMLLHIDLFRQKFSELNIEITTPDIIQTLSEDQLISSIHKYDGWIIGDDPATRRVFESGKKGKLKAAVKWGVGVDNVDFKACKDLNIKITNTPGMFGKEVADLAISYILGLSRDSYLIDRQIREGKWPKPSGISLAGKTVGILGLGDIGLNIAKRSKAFDLNIIGWDPFTKDYPKYINYQKKWPSNVHLCDFIVFSCALTEDTKHIFNHQILKLLKKGVRVINVSRGPLIDEAALIDGLKEEIVKSAALDVFEIEPLIKNHEILRFENCILGSHNASNTSDAVIRASHKAINLIYEMLNE